MFCLLTLNTQMQIFLRADKFVSSSARNEATWRKIQRSHQNDPLINICKHSVCYLIYNKKMKSPYYCLKHLLLLGTIFQTFFTVQGHPPSSTSVIASSFLVKSICIKHDIIPPLLKQSKTKQKDHFSLHLLYQLINDLLLVIFFNSIKSSSCTTFSILSCYIHFFHLRVWPWEEC